MKLGVVFPQNEIGNDPIVIRDYAQAAEQLGYDHVLVFDHVLGAHPDRFEGRFRPPILEVLEDLRGIEQSDIAIHENRNLAFRIDAQDLGVFRCVSAFKVEGHHHQFERDCLFARGYLDLRAEHA